MDTTYKPGKANRRRLREGFAKLQQVTVNDARATAERPSCLPKDWRSRVFK